MGLYYSVLLRKPSRIAKQSLLLSAPLEVVELMDVRWLLIRVNSQGDEFAQISVGGGYSLLRGRGIGYQAFSTFWVSPSVCTCA